MARKIAKLVFPDYRGRKFQFEFEPRLTFHDLNWDGGTKNEYAFVRSDGATANFGPMPAPWANPLEGQTVDVPADVLIVMHKYFCGHDTGIKIIANPCHLPKWLPAPASDKWVTEADDKIVR